MSDNKKIISAVQKVYDWLDSQTGKFPACSACGKCCDFDSYDHRLYITTPEMIYFKAKLSPAPPKQMTTGACPYNIDGKCTVHKIRFAGCRIFNCKADGELQSSLSESAVAQFKKICTRFGSDYKYLPLKDALEESSK